MLYIVGTPLGNIKDLSIRAAETLVSADVLLVEDNRSIGRLLKYSKEIVKLVGDSSVLINADQKIVQYHDQNEFQQLPYVLKILEKGMTVALISEAGMPLISDPGLQLVQHCIKSSLPYTVIPGPTASTSAQVLSGINSANSLFLGFLPKRESHLRKLINKCMLLQEDLPISLVFYESPQRIHATLIIFNELSPKAEIVVCREITKKFEEVTRGTAEKLLKKAYKGELTCVVRF